MAFKYTESKPPPSKPEYELSLHITWHPILGRKTVDAEIGTVKAHIMQLLLDEDCEIKEYKPVRLPK